MRLSKAKGCRLQAKMFLSLAWTQLGDIANEAFESPPPPIPGGSS